jgi:hypothetical protein
MHFLRQSLTNYWMMLSLATSRLVVEFPITICGAAKMPKPDRSSETLANLVNSFLMKQDPSLVYQIDCIEGSREIRKQAPLRNLCSCRSLPVGGTI